MKKLLVLLCAILMLPAYGKAEENVTVEKGGTRATITASPIGTRDPEGFVEVAITSPGRTGKWKYDQTWLDPEETGIPVAQIFSAGNRDFLFVHTYSGGASCCWSLLAFDLRDVKPLTKQVASASPINLVTEAPGCELGAAITPATSDHSRHQRSSFYCFDGKKLSKMSSGAPRQSRKR
jgi:hypothetical protein